ncbi:hypothetical protein GWI34_07160 [Actinomadura sp. DSM 109109]|nr:hypothetical protein [Actinomadura lepetitiana]
MEFAEQRTDHGEPAETRRPDLFQARPLGRGQPVVQRPLRRVQVACGQPGRAEGGKGDRADAIAVVLVREEPRRLGEHRRDVARRHRPRQIDRRDPGVAGPGTVAGEPQVTVGSAPIAENLLIQCAGQRKVRKIAEHVGRRCGVGCAKRPVRTPQHEIAPVVGQQIRGHPPVRRQEGVPQRVRGRTPRGVPGGRAAMQVGNSQRRPPGQLTAQELAEKRMAAIRGPPVAGRVEEGARVPQFGQDPLTVRPAGEGVRQAAGQPLQHGAAQKDLQVAVLQPVQHFRGGDRPGEPQARQRRSRATARHDDHPQCPPGVLDQILQPLQDLRVPNAVEIVEDDAHGLALIGQHGRQPGQEHLLRYLVRRW